MPFDRALFSISETWNPFFVAIVHHQNIPTEKIVTHTLKAFSYDIYQIASGSGLG